MRLAARCEAGDLLTHHFGGCVELRRCLRLSSEGAQ